PRGGRRLRAGGDERKVQPPPRRGVAGAVVAHPPGHGMMTDRAALMCAGTDRPGDETARLALAVAETHEEGRASSGGLAVGVLSSPWVLVPAGVALVAAAVLLWLFPTRVRVDFAFSRTYHPRGLAALGLLVLGAAALLLGILR